MAPPDAAHWIGQILAAAALVQPIAVITRLGIPELLAGGPRSAVELAELTASHPDALARVLRALAGAGVLAQPSPGLFAETPLSAALRPGAPGSMHDAAALAGAPWRAAAHHLLHTVKTGEPAFEHAFGTTLYEHLARHPDEGARFDALQAAHWPALDLARACGITGASTLVDVGGGHGGLLAALLPKLPGARGVLLDLPAAIEGARASLEASGVADRCALVAGDFFAAVPPGGDLYALGFVLHNWDDARAARILGRCREAMGPGSRLLVVENLLPEQGPPGFAALLDLEMLIYLAGGRERTEGEYRALLQGASFTLDQIIPTGTSVSVLEARPI